jgi:hypothetical protein
VVDVVELNGVVLDVVDVDDDGAGVIVVAVDVEVATAGRRLEGVVCTVAGT